ncbi:hypothetical protein [Aureimonas ureilytica]|uniref:hypothetical protein n=1 Tax=Aureimonas ureilytica TaxID=401562 RepID=UPI0007348AC8|nr:hypothetical protein [Aureimonas ureilytica]
MKDAAPRIFRSLERQFGQGEFDTVVAAAVATFGSLRNPSAAQVEDLSRLVVPLWNRIRTETKRNLAASLSHAGRVPRSLVELMLESPVEVSAPFLVSSPVLSEADLATLAASPDERVARLVRNRDARGITPPPVSTKPQVQVTAMPPAAPSLSSETPAPIQEPEIEAPSLAADFLSETPFNARTPAPGRRMPPRNADEARELLRRLATAGRGPAKPQAAPDLTDLMNAAFSREEVLFYEILTEIFSLETSMLERIVSEPTGETLAVALKALKASPADALSILMLLKPAVGLDVATFDSMARFYKALPAEECRSLIVSARHAPLTSPEVYRNVDNTRRDFGRRIARPLNREAKG